MSFEGFPGREVRAKLDHPVIDADAHIIECDFAHLDFVREIAGPEIAKVVAATPASHGPTVRGFWWGLPSGPHTGDRAMAQLPRYFRSRLDELGIDFAHCYTTRGLGHVHQPDEAVRRASCRALNMLYAEMFADVGDRLRPVAVIPTYTPQEAIEELEFAVKELGHKAIMIGTELRGPARKSSGGDPLLEPAQITRSIVMDSPHDYDPFWRKCMELKVAPACHSSSRGSTNHRASPSNYVFNHLGDFATGAEFFCRSLIFSGVTRRFPKLSFAFLEGGVAWAVNLLNDIVEHWEKRNIESLKGNLDPAKLDVDLLERLFREFGDKRHTPERIRARPHAGFSSTALPDNADEFAACALREVRDLRRSLLFRLRGGRPDGEHGLQSPAQPARRHAEAGVRLRYRPLGRARRRKRAHGSLGPGDRQADHAGEFPGFHLRQPGDAAPLDEPGLFPRHGGGGRGGETTAGEGAVGVASFDARRLLRMRRIFSLCQSQCASS